MLRSRLRLLFSVALFVALVSPLVACKRDAAPSEDQLDALARVAAASTLVVRGTPTGERELFLQGSPRTISTIAVTDVLKGEARTSLKLRQVGTERDTASVPDSEPLVSSDDSYWLFLKQSSDGETFDVSGRALYRVAGRHAVLVTNARTLPKRIPAAELTAVVRRAETP